MTNTVERGSKVTLHYKGTFEDGTQFDSSHDRGEPMSVEVGTGNLIKGFNDALVGMTEGESKTFTLEPGEAYGDVDPDAKTELSRDIFPDGFDLSEGQTIPLQGPNDQTLLSRVIGYDDSTVTVDLNHPMAGKNLTFDVDVITVDNDDETTAS
jgi:peptidylprolyl isomerase